MCQGLGREVGIQKLVQWPHQTHPRTRHKEPSASPLLTFAIVLDLDLNQSTYILAFKVVLPCPLMRVLVLTLVTIPYQSSICHFKVIRSVYCTSIGLA